MPTKAEKQAAERAEKVKEVGFYEAQENEDNSLATSDDAYIGVSPEYRNAAYESDTPKVSEDDDQRAIEEAAKERERTREAEAAKVGFRGYEPTTPHPSEATQPAAARIEQNRTVETAAAVDAQTKLSAAEEANDENTGSTAPFGGDEQKS